MKKLFITALAIVTVVACNNSKTQSDSDSFREFLTEFSKDAEFQKDRVDFPVTEWSYEMMGAPLEDSKIPESEWRHIDLRYDSAAYHRDFDRYGQEIKVWKDSAKVITKGIDNGIYVEYLFTQNEKEWMLSEIKNLSN